MPQTGKISLPILTSPPPSPQEATTPACALPQSADLWRSLEELGQTPEFQEVLHREFPVAASEWDDRFSRRHFLQLMGASLALAGAVGCTRYPDERIVPYVRPPEEVIPGKPVYYATAMPFNGYAHPVLAASHMGRPTKIEGNPDHPSTLGGTNVFMQASVLTLYDPQRLKVVAHLDQPSSWTTFLAALSQAAGNLPSLAILTETVTSPTLAAQLRELTARGAKWYQYQPIHRDHARAGANLAFGRDVNTVCDFESAAVIVSLDEDFLFGHPGSLRYARQFADQRRVRKGRDGMNRLYVAESSRSITGAMADHRVALSPSQVTQVAAALAEALGVQGVSASATLPEPVRRFAAAAAEDLQAHRGRSLVLVGEAQPPAIHALAHAINERLGNVGKTINYIEPVEANSVDQVESLRQLVRDMESGEVTGLLILGGNPVYTAPADLNFGQVLERFSSARTTTGFACFTAHLSLYSDETARLCQWQVPMSHYLESWGDARAFDGTVSIIQPLIAPLYASRTASEVLSAVLGQRDRSAYEIVRQYWRGQVNVADFETWWETALHDGFIRDSAGAPVPVSVQGNVAAEVARAIQASEPASGTYQLVLRPDPSIWDGSFANNAWLQELPKPITKLTWDNAAMMSLNTAVELGLADRDKPHAANGRVVRISVGQGATVEAAALVVPGHADGCITLTFGYGRQHGGINALKKGYDYDAYRLRNSEQRWVVNGATVQRTDQTYRLAFTQGHHLMEGRNLVRYGTVEQFRHNPLQIVPAAHRSVSLYDPADQPDGWEDYKNQKNAWAMVIDNNACIGCNACVVACQAENNIPTVGKEQVLNHREMHWLRIDTYFAGDLDSPDVLFEPLPCMHCEKAPCEVVCPVMATSHSAEGLNEMTYNRCVGTRYCSNNCPYKVRRFNFLQFSDVDTEVLKFQRNPNVTVRNRGVMEKCTYCVQRINKARIEAKKDGDRAIRQEEVVTACQQACPTQAIVFGNMNDPEHEVTRLKSEPLNYALLEELNTRPRTTYLARLSNPSAQLPRPGVQQKDSHAS